MESKGTLKIIVKTILTVILTIFVCVALLVTTACIPRSMIQKQSEVSAEYFATKSPFQVLIGDYINSMQDNYSDTVLCNITYCIDTQKPFKSVIEAKYAQEPNQENYEGYRKVVRGETEANVEYGRYWHGTMVLLRPLMMMFSIKIIRVLFGTVIILLQALIVFILSKRGHISFCGCYILSFILVQPWMFLTSLEHSTAFLTATIVELAILMKKKKKTDIETMPFFAAVGVITFFVDFLTTETLTFTLPMMILLIENNGVERKCRYILKNGVCWIAGYFGMFITKVLFLLAISGKEVAESSIAEGFLRVGGEVRQGNISIAPVVNALGRFDGAIWHNLACLYPISTKNMKEPLAWLTSLLILIVGLGMVYLFHDKIQWGLFFPLTLIAMIPYARFLVLSNHSYIHFFITYRAQMVSISVFLFFIYENSFKVLANANRRNRVRTSH